MSRTFREVLRRAREIRLRGVRPRRHSALAFAAWVVARLYDCDTCAVRECGSCARAEYVGCALPATEVE